jgi:hypothetical protein
MDVFNKVQGGKPCPQERKKHVKCPVYKNEEKIRQPNYYGVVSLLPAFEYIFFITLSARLCVWLVKSNIMSRLQAGFVKKRG